MNGGCKTKNDEMNEFSLHLIIFGIFWLQVLTVNHTVTLQVN